MHVPSMWKRYRSTVETICSSRVHRDRWSSNRRVGQVLQNQPTNLLVDAGIGKIGAGDRVFVTLSPVCSVGDAMISGEKPQGTDLELGQVL